MANIAKKFKIQMKKAKSAKDLERQMCRISGERFDKALEIYSRYLYNIAVYFSGDKYPHAPAMTLEQFKIKVPQSIYTAQGEAMLNAA